MQGQCRPRIFIWGIKDTLRLWLGQFMTEGSMRTTCCVASSQARLLRFAGPYQKFLQKPVPMLCLSNKTSLRRALWACTRVTNKLESRRPKGFGHPRVCWWSPHLQCVVVLDNYIDRSFVLLCSNILHQFRILYMIEYHICVIKYMK